MASHPQLRIYNSLSRSKEIFRPLNGNQVKFYICGPTVYDSAHMGHARAYLSFDILRRVLSSYFNYDLLYIMNVTNIDDKIIKRARQNHLYDSYLLENKKQFSKVIDDVNKAIRLFESNYKAELDTDKQTMMAATIAKVNATVREIEEVIVKKGVADNNDDQDKCEQLIFSAKDVLAEWLDVEKGATVTEMSVFESLANKFENEFFDDMKSLNVNMPDVLTRVSDYIPEISDFIKKIIDRGFAYQTSDGSVYFDTETFAQSPNHKYAKLVPEAYGDKENIQKFVNEGEGALSIGQKSEKKSLADFALWKSSKAGEPFWQSPFGEGRPGWHIECSAMSSAICGDKLDIHAGGGDLKFPHHDNEIAQCEACFDSDEWVNYFLHCGTLRIEGLKMSKSLKNFITIKEALKTFTSRQIRLLFLMHSIWDCLDYSVQTMERALQFEKFSGEFFLNVKDLLRRTNSDKSIDLFQKYEKPELALLQTLSTIKSDIHEALCDSIDTRTVIEKMRELINSSNIYIKEKSSTKSLPNAQLLKTIAEYLTSLLKMFGVIPEQTQLGYPSEDSSECSADKETILMPYLEALADFRKAVREMAIEQKNNNILKECDRLRDEVTPKLGVRFEDSGDHTTVKLVDPAVLLREQEQKRELIEAKKAAKERSRLEQEEKKKKKEAKRKVPPVEK